MVLFTSRRGSLQHQIRGDGTSSDAGAIAQTIKSGLEAATGTYKQVVKKALLDSKGSGLQGIQIRLAGRLDGSEISRSECFKEGTLPTSTKDANFGVGEAEAKVVNGVVRVEVWTYSGTV